MVAPETIDELRFARTNFVFRNSGSTPAIHLFVDVGGGISKETSAENLPTDIDEVLRTAFQGITLPPDIEHRVRFDFPDAHLLADRVRRGELYACCWATVSYDDQFGVTHLAIEPFYYDPGAQTFDRHTVGFKESNRRYRQASGYQWKIRSRYRALKNRFS
jgi:hypothetical protein